MPKYRVTKQFLTGLLEGLTITEETSVRFKPGKVYTEVLTGGTYVVLSRVLIAG
jgi:hypothetical protein